MSTNLRIGVLAFQGDVEEHIKAVANASIKLKIKAEVIPVRTKTNLRALDALIIPGGESTTIQKLCEREDTFEAIKKIKNIFGTCAGAILLAKRVANKEKDQRTLELMDIAVDRNAYGKQSESFEEQIDTKFGKIDAVFIRAPKIKPIDKKVSILAEGKEGILACEQKSNGRYYLATAFHPELTTAIFHEYFLRVVSRIS